MNSENKKYVQHTGRLKRRWHGNVKTGIRERGCTEERMDIAN
jgi:hypothetical protein